MPVVPRTLDRVALRANLLPGAFLDIYGTASLHAAVAAMDLGLFEALAHPAPVAELTATLDADERGLRSLLDTLVATGYLRRDGDTGESLYDWLGDDEDGCAVTQAGFQAVASLLADPVCDALGRVDGYRVLDVGGGHGAYAIELARRGVDVALFDRPAALGPAREAVTAADVDGVTLRGGDYLTDDLRASEECADLLARTAATLRPGGRVAVLDQFTGDAPTHLASVGLAVVDLTYLVTLGGRTHPPDAVRGWLADAEVDVVDSTSFRRAPGVRLLVGETAPA